VKTQTKLKARATTAEICVTKGIRCLATYQCALGKRSYNLAVAGKECHLVASEMPGKEETIAAS
jgi:hypothetical protein